uniref:Uncharacterized protein n=1 Tax=Escherichia coli O104:H7 TaxID=1619910 RepID=A0A0F6YRJ9_ECOLX|nr:hypothetical protein [Escherichia coli O104:H7]
MRQQNQLHAIIIILGQKPSMPHVYENAHLSIVKVI